MDLPQPKLGNITAFTITSTDLEASLKFYQQLGFGEVMRDTFPFPWIQVSDGALLIMLRKDKDPYIALTYYPTDADNVAAELESQGISFVYRPKASDMIKRYVLQSPDGVNISLVEIPLGFTQPAGATMLKMPQQDYGNPEKYVNKVCGMFGEFAQPVKDLDASILFWNKLGFVAVSKFSSPYPWAILSDGLAAVGLHQTNNFALPAITFFAADMKEKIAKLKEAGIAAEAAEGQSAIVLTTPEQQHINLFRLG